MSDPLPTPPSTGQPSPGTWLWVAGAVLFLLLARATWLESSSHGFVGDMYSAGTMWYTGAEWLPFGSLGQFIILLCAPAYAVWAERTQCGGLGSTRAWLPLTVFLYGVFGWVRCLAAASGAASLDLHYTFAFYLALIPLTMLLSGAISMKRGKKKGLDEPGG